MKKHFLSLLLMLAVIMGSVSGLVSDAMAIPYAGPSVSISESEFYYNSNSKEFGTAGNNNVMAFDENGDVLDSFEVFLEITPVDFSVDLNYGTGGGFTIYNSNGDVILSGLFNPGSVLVINATGANFESSVISTFGGSLNFVPPGLFSAALGTLVADPSDQDILRTSGGATAEIQSSAVPEPATLLLLGAGLAGMGILGRLRKLVQ